MDFSRDYSYVKASDDPYNDWVIAWEYRLKRYYFAGTVHDWEKDIDAPGVIKGTHKQIVEYADEYIDERPLHFVQVSKLTESL